MKKLQQSICKTLLTLCLFLLCDNANAQFGNIWAFGNHYKLDFNYSPPLFSDSSTAINNNKGSSSVCDSSGQLLFYTDGRYVWNKLNQQMPNGDSMAYTRYIPAYYYSGIAHEMYQGSFQAAAIVPIQNSTLYYIFTTDTYLGGPQLLRYHIVDLSLNNGLGDVILKNQIIDNLVGEKMALTRHCNGLDWWVVVHKIGTDEFHSFLVTPDSVSTIPIISHTGGFANPNLGELDVAQSKITPNGKFIVANYEIWGGMEVGTFNNQTGQIQIIYSTIPGDTVGYGCAFSADSKFLYRSVTVPDQAVFDSTGFYPVHVFKYSLSNPDSASIVQSKTLLIEPNVLIGASYSLQLAPDGNVYVSTIIIDTLPNNLTYDSSELWKIKPGIDTLFTTGITLTKPDSSFIYLGLPSFPDAIFTNHHKASLRIPTCIAGVFDSIPFFDSLLTTTRDYMWDFGDPASGINNTYNGQYPIHQFSSPGTYTVTLSLPSDCNPLAVTQQVTAVSTTAIVPIITLNNSYLESTPANQYQWYFNNIIIPSATAQSYLPITNGNYTVTITDSNGCSQTSQVYNLTTIGLKNTQNKNQFTVYPNPAKETLYIINTTKKQATVVLYDITGRAILQTTIYNYNETIDISHITNGVYFIKIDNTFNQKLVISK